MNYIPDLLGYRLEDAYNILQGSSQEIITEETFGKKSVKSDNIRIVRQTLSHDNKLKLIIAYF